MYIDFEYANKRLSDFGYIICNFNNSSGVSDIEIGCDITFNTVKNNHSSIHYKTSTSYENVFSTPFDIMKNPCGKEEKDLTISLDEASQIISWLNRHEYYKFKPLLLNDSSVIHYYGSFNIKKKTIGEKLIGFTVTFTGNTPYALGEKITNRFDFIETDFNENNEAEFSIYGVGDEYKNIYPTVTISPKTNCTDFIITNATTGKRIVLHNLLAGEIITLLGEHKILLSTMLDSHTTLYNDFNYEWFDIQVNDHFSENKYTVNTPCTISVEYEPIRKVGIF